MLAANGVPPSLGHTGADAHTAADSLTAAAQGLRGASRRADVVAVESDFRLVPVLRGGYPLARPIS